MMGDENTTFASGGFMFMAGDDGSWENLGYIDGDGVTFVADSDDDGLEAWHGRLAELANEPVTITLRPEWWSLNRLYKLVTGRYRYSVRSLRRDNKGHRRNRRAGRNQHPRH